MNTELDILRGLAMPPSTSTGNNLNVYGYPVNPDSIIVSSTKGLDSGASLSTLPALQSLSHAMNPSSPQQPAATLGSADESSPATQSSADMSHLTQLVMKLSQEIQDMKVGTTAIDGSNPRQLVAAPVDVQVPQALLNTDTTVQTDSGINGTPTSSAHNMRQKVTALTGSLGIGGTSAQTPSVPPPHYSHQPPSPPVRLTQEQLATLGLQETQVIKTQPLQFDGMPQGTVARLLADQIVFFVPPDSPSTPQTLNKAELIEAMQHFPDAPKNLEVLSEALSSTQRAYSSAYPDPVSVQYLRHQYSKIYVDKFKSLDGAFFPGSFACPSATF